MPSTVRLDGFDISDEQFPKGDPYGENVSLSKLDIFQPVPEYLRGKYDVVHLRYFMGVATDESMQVAVDNLNAMLSKTIRFGYVRSEVADCLWQNQAGTCNGTRRIRSLKCLFVLPKWMLLRLN